MNTDPTLQEHEETPESDVPLDYVPYDKITAFGSHFEHVQFLIEIGNQHPLLISKGTFPLVWLRAPTGEGKLWSTLVERNVSNFKAAVHVEIAGGPIDVVNPNPRVKVVVRGNTVIELEAISENEIHIISLDLRPVGFSIHGEGDTLQIANFSNKSMAMRNVGVAFKFD